MPLFGRRKASQSRNQITKAVEAFISAQTWEECKRIVETQRESLLTDAAVLVLDSLLEQYRSDPDTVRFLEEQRELLERCRRDGIEAAFADLLPPDVVLDQSQAAALQRLIRDQQPQAWADLQLGLANSLIQNSLGERAENLEQAIHHYTQALEVYTRQAFPDEWAMTQFNLRLPYRTHIRGELAENLEQAIQMFTPMTFPKNCRDTCAG